MTNCPSCGQPMPENGKAVPLQWQLIGSNWNVLAKPVGLPLCSPDTWEPATRKRLGEHYKRRLKGHPDLWERLGVVIPQLNDFVRSKRWLTFQWWCESPRNLDKLLSGEYRAPGGSREVADEQSRAQRKSETFKRECAEAKREAMAPADVSELLKEWREKSLTQ